MLLDPSLWSGKAHIGGWTVPAGGSTRVVEPATGETLDAIGVATPDDVTVAAERAARAQQAWARAPYTERAAVLRRAGDLPSHPRWIRDVPVQGRPLTFGNLE